MLHVTRERRISSDCRPAALAAPAALWTPPWLCALAALACLGCVCLGCGDGLDGQVEGQVLLNNQPLAEGAIHFDPVDGQSPTAGDVVKNGRYALRLPTGQKIVRITAQKVVGQRRAFEGDPNSRLIDITEQMIPARYNTQSELTREIKPGSQTLDFALEAPGAN